MTITVIGAGTMGNGIAHVFAQTGNKVIMTDVSAEALKNGIATITKNLDRMLAKEKITLSEKQKTLDNITAIVSIENAIAAADLVVEAATEKVGVKLDIFRRIDELCKPATLLASNTSSISITKIAAETKRPDKVIGMHFMNPVPLMKLVEVIRGYATSDETTKTVMDLAKNLGKIPVEVNDYPGFVSNRILMPMLNEAIICLQQGVAGVNEIDTVMKLGMAHPMGPLQLADFIGLDVCLSIMKVLYEGLGNDKYAPCPLLVNMVAAGHKGIKSGQGFYDYSKGTKELVVAEGLGKR